MLVLGESANETALYLYVLISKLNMQSLQVGPRGKIVWIPPFRRICLSRKKPRHWTRAAGPPPIHCGA